VRIFVDWAPLAARAATAGLGPDSGLAAEIASPSAKHVLGAVLKSARAIFAVCEALLAHDAFTPATQRPIPFQFIDYAWVAGAATVLALRAGAVAPAEVDAAFAGVAAAVGTMQQMECVSRNAGQVADVLAAMAQAVRSAMAGRTSISEGEHAAEDAATPVAHDLPSVVATPDLSWLGDALFMPPAYGTPSTATGTPTAHASAASGASTADPGTGAWAQLFESFV
jgi:hypothetical protein